MYYIFFAIKQKENKELSKDIFRVFQHKLSCHVPSVGIAHSHNQKVETMMHIFFLIVVIGK